MIIVNEAVAYARYSDHNQDDGFSIEYQMSEMQEYCLRNGLELVNTYIDQATTAKKVAGRDSFFRLVNDIKAGYVKTLIVYKFSRLFRNSYESHKYRKLFKKHGVKLISITQAVDDETSTGRLMINVLSDIDQFQSETISDHVKSGMREMARQGYFTGGTVPFGYKTVFDETALKPRKKYAIEEKEAEVIKELFTLYSEGYSLRFLQDELNAKGLKTRQGKPFGITTISRMLRNDFYIGTLRYKTTGYDPVVVPNAVPAIIDLETWELVQQRNEKNKLVKPRKRKDLYSLTGKIHCLKCGSHFFGIASGSEQRGKKYYYKYYICSNNKGYRSCDCLRLKKEDIEEFVLKEIKKNILNADAVEKLSKEIAGMVNSTPDDIDNALKEFKKQKAEIENRIDGLIELKLDNKISADILNRKTANEEKELNTVLLAIRKLENQQRVAVTPQTVKEYLNRFFDNLENPDDYALKNLFDNFVERIDVDNVEILVTLRVSPFTPLEYSDTSGQPRVVLNSSFTR